MEPVIRNYRSVYQPGGAAARLISLDDNPATCTMRYSVMGIFAYPPEKVYFSDYMIGAPAVRGILR
jgi:hypothetical protein